MKYRKGFGFIEFENQDLFFHKKNTIGNFFDYSVDDLVEFTLIQSRKGDDTSEAIKVINEANINARERFLNDLDKGQIIKGKIRYKTRNGFHIGLPHCSDGFLSFENISYVRSEDLGSFFMKGDMVHLKVTKVDLKKKLVYLNFKNIIKNAFWKKEESQIGSIINCRIKRKIMTQYGYSRFLLEADNILNYEFSLRRKLGIMYDDLDREEVYNFLGEVDDLFRMGSRLMVKIQDMEPEIHKVVLSWWIENDFELERAEKVLKLTYQLGCSDELKRQVYTNMLDIAAAEFVTDIMAYKKELDASLEAGDFPPSAPPYEKTPEEIAEQEAKAKARAEAESAKQTD